MSDIAIRVENLGKRYHIGHTVGHKPGDFPQGELAQEQVLTLPMYPELSEEQIGEVAGEIKRFVNL